jgi:hypothetical protein
MPLREHDRVVLTAPLPEYGLVAGDVGTIVMVHDGGYEVEFVALDGQTLAVVSVHADRVRPVRAREVTHARTLSTT